MKEQSPPLHGNESKCTESKFYGDYSGENYDGHKSGACSQQHPPSRFYIPVSEWPSPFHWVVISTPGIGLHAACNVLYGCDTR